MYPQSTRSITKLVSVIWLVHFIVDFFCGIWPVFKTLAHLDLSFAGIILGISGFVGDGFQLFFGMMSDRGLRKKLVLTGLFCSLAAVLFSYTNNYVLLFFLMLMTYLGSGTFHPAGVATVGNLIPSRKGFLVTLFASGGAVGLATSQIIYSKIYMATAGQTLILIIPWAAIFILALIMLKKAPATIVKNQPLRSQLQNLKPYRKELTLLYIAQVMQQAVQFALIFFLPDLLRANEYQDWLCFGGGHCAFIAAAAMMLVPAGYLSDHFSQRKLILIALSLSIILFYVFLFFTPASSLGLIILLMAIGACMGIVNPLGVAFANRIVVGQASVVSALMMGCVWCVAHCFGPAVGGLLTCCFDVGAISKTLGILGGMLFVSFFLTWQLPRLQRDTVQALAA